MESNAALCACMLPGWKIRLIPCRRASNLPTGKHTRAESRRELEFPQRRIFSIDELAECCWLRAGRNRKNARGRWYRIHCAQSGESGGETQASGLQGVSTTA